MTVTRRELIALIASSPIAATASGCKRAPRDIPGSFRGPSLALGHRLRDGSIGQARGEPRRAKIVIVGAGPSGLSAAWRLERLKERDFAILELEPEPGGTSSWAADGVVPYPWGAHYVPAPTRDNRALVALLEEMGALESRGSDGEPRVREELLVREPEERVFVGGSWHPGLFPRVLAEPKDLAELERFQADVDRWVAFRDEKGRRAFALPLRRSSDAAEITALDRQSAADWLGEHGFFSKLVRWYLEYACRDDYGASLSETSAWALFFYFCSRVRAPGEEGAPFVAWPEGNGRIVRHLASVAGDRLHTGALCLDVSPGPEEVELTVLRSGSESIERWLARRVILALPKFIVARVLRPFRDAPPEHLSAFSTSAWWVANIHLAKRPRSRGAPLAWDNVIYDSPSLGYVVATHQTLSDYGPTIWTYYQPMVGEDPKEARRKLEAMPLAAFKEAVVADLEKAHQDFRDAVERIDVWRWGHAMVRPAPGLIWGEARKRAMLPVGRIHFAHSDLSGVGLFEEAQDHGVRAAEEALRAEGRIFESLLVP